MFFKPSHVHGCKSAAHMSNTFPGHGFKMAMFHNIMAAMKGFEVYLTAFLLYDNGDMICNCYIRAIPRYVPDMQPQQKPYFES